MPTFTNKASPDDPRAYIVSLDNIEGDDELDTALLIAMAKEGEAYLRSFAWCLDIKQGRLVDGFGGIIALLLFQVTIRNVPDDEWVWIFIGDVPSAYLEAEPFATPHAALRRYLDGLDEWIAATEAGKPLQDLIPIEVTPSPELIAQLRPRIKTLREQILPHISNHRAR
jgi:hypothetical protein